MIWRAFVFVFLFPAFCFAQVPVIAGPSVEAIPAGEDKIVPVKEGEKAPFSGQLYDPSTALRWANWLGQYKLRLRNDLEAQLKVCRIDHEFQTKRLELELKARDDVESDLRARILKVEDENLKLDEELRNTPWYNTRSFGVVIGVVGTAALVALGVWALDTVRD